MSGCLFATLALVSNTFAQESQDSRVFDLPAGSAEETLKEFSRESGRGIVVASQVVAGVRTQAVKGRFTPAEALGRMLEGTKLTATQDAHTGAFSLRAGSPAQTSSTRSEIPVPPTTGDSPTRTAAPVRADETVALPAFEIASQADAAFVGKSSLSTTRVAVDLSELPQSVTVFNRSFLQAVNPLNLVDLLNYVGGAQVGNFNFTPGRLNIRGFSGDGDYNDGFAPSSAVNLDLALYDRFEIFKGPSSIFLAADGSPGGALNKITKSPLPERSTTITAQAGLFDANHISVDSTGPLNGNGALLYRVVAAQQYSEGRFSTSQLHRFTLMPALSYRWHSGAKLELKGLLMNAVFPSYTSRPIDPRTLQIFDLPDTEAASRNAPFQWKYHDKVQRGWGSFTHRINEHVAVRVAGMAATDLLPRVVLQTSTYNETTRTFVVPNYDGTQSFPYAVVADRTRKNYFDSQADLNLNFDVGGASSNLLIGGESMRNTTDLRSHPGTSTPWNPYVNVSPIVQVDYARISAQTFTENSTNRLFALETLKLLHNRLIVSYGLSRIEASSSSQNELNGTYATAPYTLHRNLRQYGAVFKVTPQFSVFSGYNENFSLNGTGILNGVSGPLPPRLGKQTEVGVKAELFDHRLSASVAYFDVKQLNNTQPSVPFDALNPRVLIPGVISRGFDGDANWSISRDFYLMASFAWYDAKSVLGPAAATFVQPYYRRVVTGSIPDANTAERTASMYAYYRGGFGVMPGLSVGVGVTYQSKKAITDSANQVMFGYIPGRTLVNLNLAYQASERLSYRVNVDNLFDTDYFFSARNENQMVVGDRLNVKAGVTYKF